MTTVVLSSCVDVLLELEVVVDAPRRPPSPTPSMIELSESNKPPNCLGSFGDPFRRSLLICRNAPFCWCGSAYTPIDASKAKEAVNKVIGEAMIAKRCR